MRRGHRRREADGINRRQVADLGPVVAFVVAGPEVAGGAAEGGVFAAAVDVEGMAVDEIVGMFLGQTVGEESERFAAIARARRDDAAIDRDAFFIFLSRNEPG